jgi:hypothetical protein
MAFFQHACYRCHLMQHTCLWEQHTHCTFLINTSLFAPSKTGTPLAPHCAHLSDIVSWASSSQCQSPAVCGFPAVWVVCEDVVCGVCLVAGGCLSLVRGVCVFFAVCGGLRLGVPLVDVRLDVVPLPPRSSSPTVAGCLLGGFPVGHDQWGGDRVVGGVLPRICIVDGVCVTVYV